MIVERIRGNISKHKPEYSLAFVTIILFFYFTPILDEGDCGDYLRYAEKFLGLNSILFPYRSPLYPLILAGLIKVFGYEALPNLVLAIQLVLLYCTSLLVKKTFSLVALSENKLNLILYLTFFNLSALYYSFMFITEVLSWFLFTLSIYLLLKAIVSGENKFYALAGVCTGITILSRYNLIPLLPLFFIIIALRLFILRKEPGIKFVKDIFLKSSVYGFSLLAVLLCWSFVNLSVNGNFGLFPGAGVSGGAKKGTGVPFYVGRNALIATIDSSLKISDSNTKVYEIFLEASAKIKAKNRIDENSWMNLLGEENKQLLASSFIGYKVYNEATIKLFEFYDIKTGNESLLNEKLGGFYDEVYQQTNGKVNYIRIVSFVYSLWVSSSLQNAPEKGDINFNVFPGFLITLHKLYWLCVMVGFVIVSLYLLFKARMSLNKETDFLAFSLILIIHSLLLTNVIFNTINDASRFKFPVEALVIGILVYSSTKIKLPFKK
ncbi:hypothetical protein MASR1M107_20540 [Ignavibacteriales bacterium]